jgi:hypothetical protein
MNLDDLLIRGRSTNTIGPYRIHGRKYSGPISVVRYGRAAQSLARSVFKRREPRQFLPAIGC